MASVLAPDVLAEVQSYTSACLLVHLPAPFSVVLKEILVPNADTRPRHSALTYVNHMIWLAMLENHRGPRCLTFRT
jgi:hypothetical protein